MLHCILLAVCRTAGSAARCCSMLCVVDYIRTYELHGVSAAVTICMYTVLKRFAFVVGLPLQLLAVVATTCINA